MQLGPFALRSCQAEIQGKPEIEEWIGPLKFAIWVQKSSPWWIGDLLIAGDGQFGEAFSQACEGIISADLLQRYESISRRVPPQNRRADLSWSMHSMVARLPPNEQPAMLELAHQKGWTSEELRRHIQTVSPRRESKKNRKP
jgi:hypothetical protein